VDLLIKGDNAMDITILYEDDDLLVIDKPAGITVNRAETTRHETTIQDWAEEKIDSKKYESSVKEKILKNDSEEKLWDPEVEFFKRGGVVHRLDKETSGILLLAKNPESFAALQKQFKEREVKKVYVSLAHGKVNPEEGEINVPVGRLPWNRNRFGILPGGRESKTLYKVLQFYQNPKNKETLSLVELYPHSGRTHQIRVHLKYINHPVFADFLYAGRKTARADRLLLPRVFLHAAKISFSHPTTHTTISFESPLPQNLRELLAKLYNKVA
jgi:23S rRNA pseudouridine1911/1915/1917 synthase